MPNSLGHIGIQAPLSQLIFKKAEFQWITLGCIIPDIPWILQRLLLHLPVINPYTVAQYTTIQASLFFSSFLAAACSLSSRNPQRVFLLLTFNCICHLLLDSLQIKWGNGVLLFAPFSWQQVQLNLFWPENPISYAMTGIGILCFPLYWRKAVQKKAPLLMPTAKRRHALLALLTIYFCMPFLFFHFSKQADNKFIATLENKTYRPGKIIEFDRVPYFAQEKSMQTFAKETIFLNGYLPKNSSLLSIKGKFITFDTVDVTETHSHPPYRDWASFIGIFLIVALWLKTLYKQKQ